MVLEQVESLLNRSIAESTRARECRDRLRGRSLGVVLAGLPFGVTLAVEGDALRLKLGVDAGADVRVETRPIDAFRLLEADSIAALRRAQSRVQGDLHVADGFSELLRHARPDLEEVIARWIGDVPAHALATIARGAAQWSVDVWAAGERDVADFLKFESGLLPDPLALGRFAREVERTRDDVARLEQRLERAAGTLAQRSE